MKDIIKIIFENKRYRAILYLCLYFIFFAIIFLITSIPSNKKTYQSQNEVYIEDTSYNEMLNINNEKIYISVDNNIVKFSYDNIKYIEIDSTFKYSEIIPYLKKQYIYNLVKDKEYESKTIYKDGKESKMYLINNIEINIIEKEKIIEADIKINNNIYKILY